MSVHAGGERRHFVGELRQRGGVAFGELADAAGEGLRDAVQFALHGGGDRGQPFVIHHEGLDFVLGERGVFGVELGFEVFLRGFEPGLGVGLLVEQVRRILRGPGVPRRSPGRRPISLSRAFTALAVIFCFSPSPSMTSASSPSSPLCSSRFSSSCCSMPASSAFEGVDGIPLGGEVAGNEERRGNEVGLEAALALLEVLLLRPDEFLSLFLT